MHLKLVVRSFGLLLYVLCTGGQVAVKVFVANTPGSMMVTCIPDREQWECAGVQTRITHLDVPCWIDLVRKSFAEPFNR